MQWYIRYLQDRLAHRQGEMDEGFDGGYNVDRERARLTKAQADAAEIELGKMRGELVPVSEYRRRSSAIILQARQQMLQLPARAASQLEGEPRAIIKSKLTLLLYAALASLSNGEGPESDEHPDPDIA